MGFKQQLELDQESRAMTESEYIAWRVETTVALLAAEPTVQIASFPRGVVVADEIALYLDETLMLVDNAEVPYEAFGLADLRGFDAIFGGMSSKANEENWTEEALSIHANWINIRQAARLVAENNSISYDKPISLVDIAFVISRAD